MHLLQVGHLLFSPKTNIQMCEAHRQRTKVLKLIFKYQISQSVVVMQLYSVLLYSLQVTKVGFTHFVPVVSLLTLQLFQD